MKIEENTERIDGLCEIDCGIFSNADFVNEKYLSLIPEGKRQKLNIQPNEGIFVLNKFEVEDLLNDDAQGEIIKRTYKNSDIDKFYIETESDVKYLLYIDDSFKPEKFPEITRHLERFKEILQARLDRYGENYPWWRLHRPHNRIIYENPKIATSRWGRQNTYAIQSGNFFENSDINLYIVKSKVKESITYLLGLLNSRVLNYWVLFKGRGEGVSRQIRLKQIPIHRIDFTKKKEVKAHDTLVKKVKTMIETKKKLADFNNLFKTRLTRLEDPKDVPEPDAFAITRSLPAPDLRVLRTHPKVQIEAKDIDDFYLAKVGEIKGATLFSKPTEEGQYSIKLIGKNKKQIAITAPKEIIYYLKGVLSDYIDKSLDEIKEIPLAKDLETYEAKRDEILKEVKKLLTKAKSLQAEIDEIVYELYEITQAERKIIEKELQS
jgi:hypothetical protein